MDSTVYILPCPDYARAPEKLSELLRLMGGMERFVKPGERVFLQANLLNPSPPESAVCTHPAVAAGTAALVEEAGASPCWGTAPARATTTARASCAGSMPSPAWRAPGWR